MEENQGVTSATLKRRNIDAPRIDLWIDEIVLLSPMPLIGELVNFAPGYGLRLVIITQSLRQLDQLFDHGREVITGGAAVQIYMGINDIDSARLLSDMLGNQTLFFDDSLAHDRAELASKQAVDAMLRGGDPFKAGMEQKHFAKAARHRSQQARRLMTPDEILNMPKGEGFIFMSGSAHPIYAHFPPYFEQRGFKFLPSPFFPPADRVRVKTLFGHKWLNVHRGPPPAEFRDFPQYQNHDHVWVGQ